MLNENKLTAANDFTSGSILSKMLRFMIPILGALILQAAYGAVDIMVVGRFGTTEGISGVSTGSNIMNLFTFVLAGFATSVTVLIAKYLGEKNPEKISRVIGGSIVFFFCAGIIFSVFLVVFARPIALLMQAPSEAINHTVQYIRICGAGFVFILAYNLISAVFRGLGDSKSPLLFVGIACAVNIVGDLVLIAGFKMNVAGAAIATVAAQAVSVVLSIIIIKRKKLVRINRKDLRFNDELRGIIKIGIPIGFQELLTQISFMCLVAFINRLGIEASSGYGVANKIVAFVMLVPSSLMQSMSSFVSQNVGAKNERRATKSMLTGMAIGALIGIFVFLLIFFKGDFVSSIFTDNENVIRRSYEYLRGFAIEAVVTSVLFSFIGYFNGHGATMLVMIQGLAQSFLVRLPMSYIMSVQPDASLSMIGLAAPTATVFGIVLNLVFFIFYQKKLNIKGNENKEN